MVSVTHQRETRTARPGILLAARVFFSRHTGNSLPVLGNARWIPAPTAELVSEAPLRVAGPGLIGGVAYLPFSASYCATISAGMRPRSLTSRSRSLAQLRISLLLASFAAVLRTRAGRPADPVTLRAALT